METYQFLRSFPEMLHHLPTKSHKCHIPWQMPRKGPSILSPDFPVKHEKKENKNWCVKEKLDVHQVIQVVTRLDPLFGVHHQPFKGSRFHPKRSLANLPSWDVVPHVSGTSPEILGQTPRRLPNKPPRPGPGRNDRRNGPTGMSCW